MKLLTKMVAENGVCDMDDGYLVLSLEPRLFDEIARLRELVRCEKLSDVLVHWHMPVYRHVRLNLENKIAYQLMVDLDEHPRWLVLRGGDLLLDRECEVYGNWLMQVDARGVRFSGYPRKADWEIATPWFDVTDVGAWRLLADVTLDRSYADHLQQMFDLRFGEDGSCHG